MRRRATIIITDDPIVLRNIQLKIESEWIRSELIQDILKIVIYEDTNGYKILMDEINKGQLRYTFAEGREYTKEEIKNAKYFHCEIMYPWEHDPKNAEYYGTQYSRDDVCSQCGFGKKQISDLILNVKKMKKYHFAQIIPEFIITEHCKKVIEENNLTGYELRPVKDFKDREEPVLYQLIVTNILPKMSKEVRFQIWDGTYCEKCETNGLYLRSEVAYESSSLSDAKDFNLTGEHIGVANHLGRHLIVSARVREIFNKNKIKSLAYEPVRII